MGYKRRNLKNIILREVSQLMGASKASDIKDLAAIDNSGQLVTQSPLALEVSRVMNVYGLSEDAALDVLELRDHSKSSEAELVARYKLAQSAQAGARQKIGDYARLFAMTPQEEDEAEILAMTQGAIGPDMSQALSRPEYDPTNMADSRAHRTPAAMMKILGLHLVRRPDQLVGYVPHEEFD